MLCSHMRVKHDTVIGMEALQLQVGDIVIAMGEDDSDVEWG